jgi:formylglycine-generating enzyme
VVAKARFFATLRMTTLVLLSAGCSQPNVSHSLGAPTACAAYTGLPSGWLKDPHAGMVQLAGGEFEMGSVRGFADERPVRKSRVDPFWIDRTEVTNAQFAAFVAATGYVTEAEQGKGATVFVAPKPDQPVALGDWWQLLPTANWRSPDGGSPAAPHDPVVDITLADARAYAKWLGREIPTESQWEFAAKAGRANEESDRAVRDATGKPQANFWQGLFPAHDAIEDGYASRAPVGCYAANPFGLHDMVGNVWEWTVDRYAEDRNVIKGGSYLCALNYCARARASSRQPQEVDLPAAHVGFRTIKKPAHGAGSKIQP